MAYVKQFHDDVHDNLVVECQKLSPKKKFLFEDTVHSYNIDQIIGTQGRKVICQCSETDEIVKIPFTELTIEDLFGVVDELRNRKP